MLSELVNADDVVLMSEIINQSINVYSAFKQTMIIIFIHL